MPLSSLPWAKKLSSFFDADVSAQPKGLHLNKDLLTLVVNDQGLAIPLGEEASVFDKFIQSSKTKTVRVARGLVYPSYKK
jgi:hypothetical protein